VMATLLDVATPGPALGIASLVSNPTTEPTGQVGLCNGTVSMTTANTYYNMAGITLTAGRWAIYAEAGNTGGTPTITAALSLTSANGTNAMPVITGTVPGASTSKYVSGVISVSSTTTIYLNQACSTAGQTGQGFIRAIRIQ
jgi:hypothetical protein